MWLCALLALLTLDEAQPLREVRPFNVDPSAISNIELLIPLSIPAESRERPERPDRDLSSESDEEEEEEDAPGRRPRDREPFSSIPAYAFTLDDAGPSPRARGPSTAPPMSVKSRSLYLAQLWPRADEQSEEESGAAQQAGQEVCRALARQQSGGARELLLYVCAELLDALAPRGACCAGQRAVRPRAAPAHKRGFPMPWFGPIGGRREWRPVQDRALSSQRVFV